MTDGSISPLLALNLNLLEQRLPAVPVAVCSGPTVQTCQPQVMHAYSQDGVPSLNPEKQVSTDTVTQWLNQGEELSLPWSPQ